MKVALERIGSGYAAAGAHRLLVRPGPENAVHRRGNNTVVTVKAPALVDGYRLIVDPRPVLAALTEFRPTSLELSDKWTLLPVTRWARRRGVPTWLFSHERLDGMLPGRVRLERGLARPIAAYNALLTRCVDGVIVTSHYARGEFARAKVPTELVPLGVDLEMFRPDRAEYRPQHEPLRLIHVGRLSREKDPELAIRTALELHRRSFHTGQPVTLDVYGDGPQGAYLRELGAGSPVRFHGYISDRAQLAQAIAQADISISACPTETFGLAVLEALASGTPVITANTGGGSEIVTPLCGASAAPNPVALADAVERVARMPRAERQAQARARAERYSWDRTVEQLLDVHSRHLADFARTA